MKINKLFYITLKDISALVVKKTRLFVILIISLVAVSYTLFFLTGILLKEVKSFKKVHLDKLKEYSLLLGTDDLKSYNGIKELFTSLKESKNLPYSTFSFLTRYIDYEKSKSGMVYGSEFQDFEIIKGRYFSNEEINNSDKVIIIPSNYLIDGMEYYEIIGEKYKVVGVSNSFNRAVLPYTHFLNGDFALSEVYITFDSVLNKTELSVFKQYVNESLPDAELIVPDRIDKQEIIDYLIVGSIIAGVMLFAFSNLIGLFKFWVHEKSYEFCIFNQCGIKRIHLFMTIILDVFIICIFSFILAYGIFQLTLSSYVKNELVTNLTFTEVLVVFIIYITNAFIAIRGTAMKYSKIYLPIEGNSTI
ncbi:MAG: hypothetical protein PHV32_04195 [Eubacteriales bacterium]|nr:hypothetical protein [Eubacteriales bacterium]